MFRLGLFLAAIPAFSAALYNSTADTSWKSWTAMRGAARADEATRRDGRTVLRVEPNAASDAIVRSSTVTLRPGKHYELTGWVRTESLQVRDSGRSPIAVGASLAMGSMPFDVHSESLAGTRDWTRLKLRFTATRAQDAILLRVAEGGTFSGRAWFDAVAIEEVAADPGAPQPAGVTRFGPAYRYPSAGWIYLHIEGKPYERGYQHGYLMPKEIERYLERCAALLDAKSRQTAWDNGRVAADALFLRGFDDEIRDEMKGIADGAAAAGAKWHGRAVDLVDIVTANVIVELGDLRAALRLTRTGLEGIGFQMPEYRDVPPNHRCSAFAATGKATRDGRMIVAHTTWWPLTLSEQTNVMLDIKPEKGHRILMQSYPGGIESGTDWYQNDAGVVLTETTIRQSPFNREGTPVAYRARKAIQYGANVDQVVEHLGTKNNGLYTNEWIIGDAKNDEIAMYELGTYKTKLWRSSKNEWFGGTEGFYWGNNNAKDHEVRLEYLSDSKGRPEDITFSPSVRDIAWRRLYREHKGSIDEQFAYLAFRSSPLVGASAMDAKVATAEMASNMMVWAAIGKPNQRERLPAEWDQNGLNDGLYPSGYALFSALRQAPASAPAPKTALPATPSLATVEAKHLWFGWLLPASDADLWLTAGAARYYGVLSATDPSKDVDAVRISAWAAIAGGDTPLSRIVLSLDSSQPNRLATNKGALLLHALRGEVGEVNFLQIMRSFYDANTTRRVTTAAFRAGAERIAGRSLAAFFTNWLDRAGIPGETPSRARNANSVMERFGAVIIAYGTMADAGANRYAAEQYIRRDHSDSSPAIKKDFELTPDDLRNRDVVFIGGPQSNQALAPLASDIGFVIEDRIQAFANPHNSAKTIVVVAGSTALETVKLAKGN